MPKGFGPEPFEAIVDRIYLAAAEPEHWPAVLHDIGGTVGAPLVVLLTMHSDRWLGWTRSTETPATVDDYLRSDAAARSQTTPRLLQANHPGFLSASDLFTDEEFLADPVMTEFGSIHGFHHGAATAIHMPTGDSVVVHLQRRAGMPRFDGHDIARLDAFRPHLARAGLLAARSKLARMRAATEALAMVGLPAAVVDLQGRVTVANRLIQETAQWVAWLPGDRVAIRNEAANALLQHGISELRNPAAASVRSIAVSAQPETRAAVVHLVPITGSSRETFAGASGMLVVTPVSEPGTPTIPLLRALFDLTPSEARVAAGIAQGASLVQLSRQFGVGIETVRAQTKSVFAKTGTTRQAQVAALLAALPKIPLR